MSVAIRFPFTRQQARKAESQPWPLHDNGTMSLRPGAGGVVVRIDRGQVLLTQEGDRDDHVLGPGDAYRAAGRKAVVLWALSEASVALSAA